MRTIRLKFSSHSLWSRQSKSRPVRLQKRLASTTAVETEVQNCDVVIVGGGPAGLAFANALGVRAGSRKQTLSH